MSEITYLAAESAELLEAADGGGRRLAATRGNFILPSARRRLAVLAQVLRSGGGHRDEGAASRRMMTRDESAVVGVLPHGKTRTRRPPRREHLGVRPGVRAHPLQEVEDQAVDGVGQRRAVEIGV
jgi:hypothetical protein